MLIIFLLLEQDKWAFWVFATKPIGIQHNTSSYLFTCDEVIYSLFDSLFTFFFAKIFIHFIHKWSINYNVDRKKKVINKFWFNVSTANKQYPIRTVEALRRKQSLEWRWVRRKHNSGNKKDRYTSLSCIQDSFLNTKRLKPPITWDEAEMELFFFEQLQKWNLNIIR